MEHTILVVYIDDTPHRFHIYTDPKEDSVTYHVSHEDMGEGDINAVPDHLEFNIDGEARLKSGVLNAKQAQTAQIIWKEILRKLNR